MEPKNFEWDAGNSGKNTKKHGVSDQECEEVFYDINLKVFHDAGHSKAENRYYGLGETFSKRKIFMVFTIRNDKIRVISARDMNRKERIEHEKKDEENTEV
ncbi:MAG TPA: BrnT family toxin [bacterium]|nr:BrnT family toxin [bacterium]